MTISTTDTGAAEAARVQFDRQALGLRTAIPGIVVAVAADGTTVDVQPAISMTQRLEDVQVIPLPVLRGVPLHVAGSEGAGLFVCVPVTVGDDGLIVICDRALDDWQYSDGVRPPPDAASPRHHDLTDAVFIPGLKRKSQAIPSFPASAIEIRTTDGGTKVSVSSAVVNLQVGSVTLAVSAAGIVATMAGASVTLNASGLSIVGGLTIDGHAYLTHHHGGVQTGIGNTGGVIP